jgi:hemoglobin-like flavoprotein
MTTTDIALVQDSFRRVIPIADEVASLFYARIFELDPNLRNRFSGNMAEQGRKLVGLIALAVANLEQPAAIVAAFHNLGPANLRNAAKANHCSNVETALLWTLEKRLGPEFTPQVRDAWNAAFAFVCHTVLTALQKAEAA